MNDPMYPSYEDRARSTSTVRQGAGVPHRQDEVTSIQINSVSALDRVVTVEWEANIWETGEYEVEANLTPTAAGTGEQKRQVWSGPASWGTTLVREAEFQIPPNEGDQWLLTVLMRAPAAIQQQRDVVLSPSGGGSTDGGDVGRAAVFLGVATAGAIFIATRGRN